MRFEKFLNPRMADSVREPYRPSEERQTEERLAAQPLVKVAAGDNRTFMYLQREYRPVQGFFYLPAEVYRKFKSINASAWRDYELVADTRSGAFGAEAH